MHSEIGVYYDLEKSLKNYGILISAVAKKVDIDQRKLASYKKKCFFPLSVYWQCHEKLPALFPLPRNYSEEKNNRPIKI